MQHGKDLNVKFRIMRKQNKQIHIGKAMEIYKIPVHIFIKQHLFVEMYYFCRDF